MSDTLVLKDNMLRFLLPGAASGGALCVAEFTCWPGSGPPPHTHDLHEWFYVLSGEVEFSGPLGGQWTTVRAAAGDSLYIPPRVPHTYRAAGDGLSRFVCTMSPGSIEGYFRAIGLPCSAETAHELLGRELDMDAVRAALAAHGIGIYDPAVPWTGADVVFTKAEQASGL